MLHYDKRIIWSPDNKIMSADKLRQFGSVMDRQLHSFGSGIFGGYFFCLVKLIGSYISISIHSVIHADSR